MGLEVRRAIKMTMLDKGFQPVKMLEQEVTKKNQ